MEADSRRVNGSFHGGSEVTRGVWELSFSTLNIQRRNKKWPKWIAIQLKLKYSKDIFLICKFC